MACCPSIQVTHAHGSVSAPTSTAEDCSGGRPFTRLHSSKACQGTAGGCAARTWLRYKDTHSHTHLLTLPAHLCLPRGSQLQRFTLMRY